MTLEAARSEPHSKIKTRPFGVRGMSSTTSSQKEIIRFAYCSWCVIWYKLTLFMNQKFYYHLHYIFYNVIKLLLLRITYISTRYFAIPTETTSQIQVVLIEKSFCFDSITAIVSRSIQP